MLWVRIPSATPHRNQLEPPTKEVGQIWEMLNFPQRYKLSELSTELVEV